NGGGAGGPQRQCPEFVAVAFTRSGGVIAGASFGRVAGAGAARADGVGPLARAAGTGAMPVSAAGGGRRQEAKGEHAPADRPGSQPALPGSPGLGQFAHSGASKV